MTMINAVLFNGSQYIVSLGLLAWHGDGCREAILEVIFGGVLERVRRDVLSSSSQNSNVRSKKVLVRVMCCWMSDCKSRGAGSPVVSRVADAAGKSDKLLRIRRREHKIVGVSPDHAQSVDRLSG